MDPWRELKVFIIARQHGLCAICGRSLGSDAVMHEAIVKRGDLPGDRRVFSEYNCVAVHGSHPKCTLPHNPYGNTKEYDRICASYLLWHYGPMKIAKWIEGLNLKTIHPRVRRILNAVEAETTSE